MVPGFSSAGAVAYVLSPVIIAQVWRVLALISLTSQGDARVQCPEVRRCGQPWEERIILPDIPIASECKLSILLEGALVLS